MPGRPDCPKERRRLLFSLPVNETELIVLLAMNKLQEDTGRTSFSEKEIIAAAKLIDLEKEQEMAA